MGYSVFPAPAGASPYGGTITNLGFVSGNGLGTVTISGLSAYKKVVFYWQGLDATGSSNLLFRINGDSNDNYAYQGLQTTSNGVTTPYRAVKANSIVLGSFAAGVNNSDAAGTLTLQDSNSAAYKVGNASASTRNNAGTSFTTNVSLFWASTSAISSVSFVCSGSTFLAASGTTAGFYAIGYN